MKVLIIDDDPHIRRMMYLTLEADHEVHEAADGPAALGLLAREPDVDVVLLDQKLPGTSGLALVTDIRRLAPRARVVMVTAHASLDLATDALRAGARHFLSKPTTPEMLRAVVHVAGREAREGTRPRPHGSPAGEAITTNGFRVDLSGEPTRVDRDGSAVHTFVVTQVFSNWSRPVRVHMGTHAFQRSARPQQGAGSPLGHTVAGHALAAYLFQEGMLPEGDVLRIDEVNPAHLAAAVRGDQEIAR